MAARNSDFVALWSEARERYEEVTGKKLKDLPMPKTTDELISSVNNQNKDLKHFREKSGTLFTVLSAAVKPIELVGNLAAGAAGAVFPPSSMVFGAAMYLINAAKGVSASLDAIAELLSTLKDFTIRLKIYNREDLSEELRGKLTEILTTVIEIFARSTKVVKEGSFVNRLKSFSKNVLLGSDTKMQGLLGKLDKLTVSEDRLVGAETLVETKKTSRNVEAVQVQMTESTAQLGALAISSNEMSAGVGQILNAMEEQKEERDVKHIEAMKKALMPSISPQDRFDEIKREHVPDSGNWILEEENLKAWTSYKSPILWISGGPGSGKSFLTFTIISKLQNINQEQSNSTSHSSVAWFFFRDNKDQTRSFGQALRDMSYQIAQTDPLYAKYVVNLCRSGVDVSSIRSAWQRLFVEFFIEGDNPECNAYLVFDGIDESFEDDRITFFDLLRDVLGAGSESRLHVAMLGRPQIIEEIHDELDETPPTIYVDWTKNGSDIAHYVEASIAKSRVLSKISRKLKDEVVQTLITKAEGMFMWVKLNLAELSKKSRESAIREALKKAPRGLPEMIRHVLQGFSASLKDESDVDDLNDMLSWVTLAKRPLFLGEIDSMLRLKSEEGDSVLNLEGKLRKQFASFFVLTRDDTLTTADLQAPKKLLDEDEQVFDETADLEDGLDDVDNETDFNSNPQTTTVAFAHASIGDFFKDPKEGKVSAPGNDYLPVGVALNDAKLQLFMTCLNLIVDESLQPRMTDTVNLRIYAASSWKEHLEELDRSKVVLEDKLTLAKSIEKMFHDDSILIHWAGARGYVFWKADAAKIVLPWLTDSEVIDELSEETKSWAKQSEANPVELWEPAMKFTAARWLNPQGKEWLANNCTTILYSYFKRKAGEEVTEVPKLSVKDIEETAEWAGFEQDAEWHRKVAMTMREREYYDDAGKHFEKAIELNPALWSAITGLSKTLFLQDKYLESIEAGEKALKLAEADDKIAPKTKKYLIWDIHKQLARSYDSWSEDIEVEDGDMHEFSRRENMSYEHFKQAFLRSNTDQECMWACLQYLQHFANPIWKGKVEEEKWKGRDLPTYPTLLESQQRVMELIHELENTPGPKEDDDQTLLDSYLTASRWTDINFEIMAAAAKATGELEFLQDKYKRVMGLATKNLQPVIHAYLGLCLASLYFKYGDDEEKAIRIWEAVGTEGSASTRVTTDIAMARTMALNALGAACLSKAIGDESNASRWITKMERIAAKKRVGATAGMQDTVPPNDIALYLAAWYRKQGRMEEAREVVRAHVSEAIMMLQDEDPGNDFEAYGALANAFLALGDDVNTKAILHSMRKYEDGMAMLDSEILSDDEDDDGEDDIKEGDEGEKTPEGGPEDEKASEGEKPSEGETISEETNGDQTDGPAGNDEKHDSGAETEEGSEKEKETEEDAEDSTEDDDEEEYTVGTCMGPCNQDFISWDGVYFCRYCLEPYCDECYDLIIKKELPFKACGDQHDFLLVPDVTEKFKEGEMPVDDKIMTVEEWKTGIKKDWGL